MLFIQTSLTVLGLFKENSSFKKMSIPRLPVGSMTDEFIQTVSLVRSCHVLSAATGEVQPLNLTTITYR